MMTKAGRLLKLLDRDYYEGDFGEYSSFASAWGKLMGNS